MKLEDCEAVIRKLEAKSPLPQQLWGMNVVTSEYLPAGWSLCVGHNSFAAIDPMGRIFAFERRDAFSPWEPRK